jgi:hypothetical protein
MQPRARLAVNMLAALSLVLAVAVLALWVWSFWVEVEFDRRRGQVTDGGYWRSNLSIISGRGGLGLDSTRLNRALPSYQVEQVRHDPDLNYQHRFVHRRSAHTYPFWYWDPHDGKTLGFRFRSLDESIDKVEMRQREIGIVIPYWFLFLATLALPAVVIVQRRRRSTRTSRSLCLQCGYDLRASPDRCPECGTPASNPQSAPAPPPKTTATG